MGKPRQETIEKRKVGPHIKALDEMNPYDLTEESTLFFYRVIDLPGVGHSSLMKIFRRCYSHVDRNIDCFASAEHSVTLSVNLLNHAW